MHRRSTVMSWPSLVRHASRLRLPFWLWAIIIGFAPTRLLATLDYLVVPPGGPGGYLLDTAVVLSIFIVYFVYAIRFISSRMEQLSDYVKRMSPDVPVDSLRIPFRAANILAVWVILLVAITLLFGFPSPTTVFSEHIAVIAYFFLILASFLWVYGYSMYAIHQAGKLPLRLKPFTEDRTLGLKPFGTASLRLASIYAVFPVTLTLLELVTLNVEIPGGITITFAPLRLTDVIFSFGLILAGIALFFLPLLSIRKRLQEAKRQELSWVTPRYTTIIQKLREQISKTPPEDRSSQTQALADELTMMRQVQQDIQKIQSWPFDLGVVSRLATVLVIPPILGVLARILILVFLHL
ncbi:MAG: hypothetical protein AUI50_08295 [Crenarchaeota archaeon 13_1_40CM_2_52_14]|nr:MAG: hypothetical protein AUI50_08295 [Crenarchaeota archaeon 13_1_40CM_2_52_14]OLE69544.1 MAG: hypothetical protein AUF78_10815 [archaeon 13_1_20CM_2_51_12]